MSVKPEERIMAEAVKEAKKAFIKGEVPVGAVVVRKRTIIARAHNLIKAKKDPSAHAEMLAVKKAAAALKNERLTGCDIYTTLEPCVMCAGAMLLARIEKLFFGAAEPKTGACGSLHDVLAEGKNNHKIKVRGGILEKECAALMRGFFAGKRKKRRGVAVKTTIPLL
ncbi:MAG TPA: nucleoside deaminase [bacterium]|nr:nucleoside deaminase [bacterium]